MRNLIQDLRYGIRVLLKNPGFSVLALLTLALGIGATTAIFSVVNSVLLRPLPYRESERIVLLSETKEGAVHDAVSYEDFVDFRNRSTRLEQVAATSPSWTFTLTGGTEPETVTGLYASVGFFPMLGVGPAQGRLFLPEEDRPGGPRVVVVSDALWKRQFGGDPEMLRRTLTLDGSIFEVIGILPPNFEFLNPGELFVPLSLNPLLDRGRTVRFLTVVGKVKPDVGFDEANAEVATIASQLAQQYPSSNAGFSARLTPLHKRMTAGVQALLLVLFGSVVFVLLIACANVANLMLARASTRRREMAIRAALGAGRGRIIRQLLVESTVLALCGGAAGVLVCSWGIDLLLTLSPTPLPRQAEVGIDATVLGFALLLSLGSGLIFGLAPALGASSPDLNESLKDATQSAAGPGRARSRLRGLLISAEIALALVLLIGSGLLMRSFVELVKVDPGFRTENVLALGVGLPRSHYAEPQRRADFFRQLEAGIRQLPGVVSVGAVSRLPLRPDNNITSFLSIEGRPTRPGEAPEVDFRRASSGYFATLGIPLLKGRFLNDLDGLDNPPVTVINEAAARRFWPTEDPIGKRIQLGSNPSGSGTWLTIVGVVGSVRHVRLDAEPRPEVYRHYQTSPLFGPIVVVRASSDPMALVGALRNQVHLLDRDLPISDIRTMGQIVSRSVAQRRFTLTLLGVFSAIAMLLAAVGIYGVMSYLVTQRTREIGIRRALGAQASDVLRLVVGQGLLLTLSGVAAGLVASFVLTRVLEAFLFGVSPTDPLTFLAVALLLTCVALLACYIPARRATRVDPMVALRYE